MQFLWACPSCGSPLRVDTINAGRKSRCPKCQAIITLPAADPSAAPAANPPVAKPAVPSARPPQTSAPKSVQSPGAAVPIATPKAVPTATPIVVKPASPPSANPAVPVVARVGGRRMLPPPRKPTADAVSNPPPEVIVNPEPANDPADADTLFASAGETSADAGDADFFSGIVDSSAAPADSMDPFLAGPTLAASGSTISRSHRPPPSSQKAKNQKLIWITAGGIAAVAVAIVVAIMVLGGNGGPPADAPAKTGVLTHLVFDWPENERFGAKLEIDDASREIPLSGAMDFELPTGSHRIALRQLGHAKIDQTVQLKTGERYQFKPEWKPAQTSGAQGAIATAANSGDADMLVTDALPELKHWSTDLDAAKRQAASEKKDVLVVFFGADKREWCLQLAKDLLVNKEFRKYADSRFELVLIEAPTAASTVDGKGIGHAAEIAKLAASYTVKSFPTIVLTDSEGTAYAREEYKQLSVVDHLKKFSSGLALRKERDKMFAPTETGTDAARVGAAQLALEWLEKKDLAALYAAKIHSWRELAEKVDPKNENGQVEAFFLAELRERLRGIQQADSEQIRGVIQFLDDWTKAGRKFKNGNIGASVYLNLANLLFESGAQDEAIKYVQYAYDYHPTDPRLRTYLDRLHDVTTSPISFGSGFVFAAGGYVLTNNHVIAGEGKIFVRVPGNKEEIPAEVVGTSPQLDVAVLKMVGKLPELKPLSLATATLPIGTEVVAMGYPLGQEDVKLTQGPISAPPSEKEHFYVLDLRVNPGNSGGPLVDMRGEVVGIVSAKTISRDEKEDSYGLAIPGETVAGFVKKLTPAIPDYHPLTADESAKLPELDKLTKVAAMVKQSVVQIVKRRG